MTVNPEVKEPEVKLAEAPTTSQPQSPPEIAKQPEETIEQINWRKFRKEREKERRDKEDSDRRAAEAEEKASAMKAAMEALISKPHQSPPHQNLDDIEETEEQRIDKRVEQALERDRQRREKERSERELKELPQKLSSTFNDFNQVCTQENLDYLEYHYPEVARRFKSAPETFETWADFYKVIKRFVPNHDSKKDQAKIEKNMSKPQSMSSPGISQTGDQAPSKALDEKRRQDNWARMQRVMKGAK